MANYPITRISETSLKSLNKIKNEKSLPTLTKTIEYVLDYYEFHEVKKNNAMKILNDILFTK